MQPWEKWGTRIFWIQSWGLRAPWYGWKPNPHPSCAVGALEHLVPEGVETKQVTNCSSFCIRTKPGRALESYMLINTVTHPHGLNFCFKVNIDLRVRSSMYVWKETDIFGFLESSGIKWNYNCCCSPKEQSSGQAALCLAEMMCSWWQPKLRPGQAHTRLFF